MLEPVSVGLKFAFLAVLYLFLLWVAGSALHDPPLRVAGPRPPGPVPPPDATGIHAASQSGAPSVDGRSPRLVVDHVPGHDRGMEYDIDDGATLGRGDVEIHLEDGFASSRHARLVRQGGAVVLEDLGSTNGTYLNDELLQGPQPLHRGDRIRIGDSTFVYED
jgi:hypothetical protein